MWIFKLYSSKEKISDEKMLHFFGSLYIHTYGLKFNVEIVGYIV